VERSLEKGDKYILRGWTRREALASRAATIHDHRPIVVSGPIKPL